MNTFYKTFKPVFLFFLLAILTIPAAISQTTLTTTFANNNGFALVTFNFTNNNANAVVITDIASVCGTGGQMDVAAFYNASAINGLPGAIEPANGWNQFGSATITAIANTTTSTPQPFMSGLSLIVPAGATYGIAVQAESLQYSSLAPGTYTEVGGGAVITTGSNIGYAGDAAPNAPDFTPRGFIGSITFTGASACTGTPAPGNTISTVNPVCPGINFTLSTQNSTPGSGVAYQWQSSVDGILWMDITNATNTTYTTSQLTETFYRANVTCAGATTPSNPLLVTVNPPQNCYCVAGSPDVDFEKISNVTYGSINNSSTSTSGYEDFTAVSTVMEKQNPQPITVTIDGGFAADQIIVFIDFNQNGNFDDPGEKVLTSAPGAGPLTGIITIPSTAMLGTTRLRVRLHDSSLGANSTPCGNSAYGQVEDYSIDITACTQGAIIVQPVAVTTNCGGTASFSVDASGTGLTYEWQVRTSTSAPWAIVNNGGMYSGANTSTLTISGATSAMNGYQYGVAVGGGCTAKFLSAAVALTVNPLVAAISTPLPVEVCTTGSPQAIAITNASGATTTVSIPSGALAQAIPEGNIAGTSNVINVSTIPAGVNVVGLSVTLNISHTWVGDLVAVLKGPNGQVINLLAVLNETGGVTPSTGFTNTVISSEGVTPLDDAAADPFTGTYAANLYLNPIVGFGAPYPDPMPVGPTGFLPTTANWTDLFSTANGDWTLALYDAYPDPPQGNLLNNWSINITYGAPATGIFTPGTGLFTDAAGTVPYTGTAVNTVYAYPTANTTYSLVVTTPSCVSAPLEIPVLVAQPISGSSTLTVTAACAGGTTTITSSAPAGGTTYNHQWYESTDGGTTFYAIMNGGNYSGATSATLSISGLLPNMTGYQYKDSIFAGSCNSSVMSDVATLTVNPLPDVQIAAGPSTEIHPGLTTTITAAVSPNAASTYQWYKNGIPVPGATGARIVVDIDNLGEYSVSVDDVAGCSNTSASITISSRQSGIAFIYPSPNTGQFQVRYFAGNGNLVPRIINIYDSKGARIYSKTFTNSEPYSKMEIDLSNHGKGIYRVELSDRNGRRIKTGSVIIL